MKEAFGKWLLDIAKYMVTALLISTIFADMKEPIIIYIVVLLSVIILLYGLSIIDESEKEKEFREMAKNTAGIGSKIIRHRG